MLMLEPRKVACHKNHSQRSANNSNCPFDRLGIAECRTCHIKDYSEQKQDVLRKTQSCQPQFNEPSKPINLIDGLMIVAKVLCHMRNWAKCKDREDERACKADNGPRLHPGSFET
jgi:hypothetical protein